MEDKHVTNELLLTRRLTSNRKNTEFTGFESHPAQPEGLQNLSPSPDETSSGLICLLSSFSCLIPSNVFLSTHAVRL